MYVFCRALGESYKVLKFEKGGSGLHGFRACSRVFRALGKPVSVLGTMLETQKSGRNYSRVLQILYRENHACIVPR